jgi:hypothetical protein
VFEPFCSLIGAPELITPWICNYKRIRQAFFRLPEVAFMRYAYCGGFGFCGGGGLG